MKYGDTLQLRSTPLWETHNIDYNDIKQLIKVRTSYGQGQAKSIPGSNSETKASEAFAKELYMELRGQHQRIDDFVQSKAGEIARRLAHLEKQVAQLELRNHCANRARIPVRRLEKYSRIEEATLKAGEDIQSLSRFVGAQRLAFQKLLKKYKKWTSSPDLGNDFRTKILNQPSSFSEIKFEPLLAQWTEVLTAVRAPFANGIKWKFGSGQLNNIPSKSLKNEEKSSQTENGDIRNAVDLQAVWRNGSSIDIDTALAISPLGGGAARASYWVHPDNLVQIHVLLLQYTRMERSESLPSSPTSSKRTPRGSVSSSSGRHAYRPEDEVNCIICDDLQRFAERLSGETIGVSENSAGTAPEKAAASIRYTSSSEAIVAIGTAVDNSLKSKESPTASAPKAARLKRKGLRQLFAPSCSDQYTTIDDTEEVQLVREWFDIHQEVQPLVQIQAKRTRFVGLDNDDTRGLWVTLDKDIMIRKCSSELLAKSDPVRMTSEVNENDQQRFPHAVLEVRVESDADADLIRALNNSHLAERVRGFSLETHAVATLCKPKSMARPFWLPLLKQDIRKIPAPTKSKLRSAHGHLSPLESSTRHTSVSASSAQNGPSGSGFSFQQDPSSATSIPDTIAPLSRTISNGRPRRSNRRRMSRTLSSQAPRVQRQRYWNEFDDGSEGSENEAYTILIDPNASFSLPGAATLSKWYGALTSHIESSKDKVSSWFAQSPNATTNERQPLINGGNGSSGVHSPDILDSDDDTSTTQRDLDHRRSYSTFPLPHQSQAVRARESLLLRFCIACFCTSFVLLIIATILQTTGRRKAETTVAVGVIIGVAASLVSAIIGVGSMLGRKDDVGGVHRAIVFIVFMCVVLGSGGLLTMLGDASKKQ